MGVPCPHFSSSSSGGHFGQNLRCILGRSSTRIPYLKVRGIYRKLSDWVHAMKFKHMLIILILGHRKNTKKIRITWEIETGKWEKETRQNIMRGWIMCRPYRRKNKREGKKSTCELFTSICFYYCILPLSCSHQRPNIRLVNSGRPSEFESQCYGSPF